MNNFSEYQLNLIETIELIERVEAIYINGVGDPLPWQEELYFKQLNNENQ